MYPGGILLNKAELVTEVAERAGMTKKDAEKAVNAVVESIEAALTQGDRVSLVGFGTFEVRQRAARVGRNPRTGATLEISGSKVPAFKAGKALKESVAK
jgi:DNA-binding protein HU-beta